MRSLVAPIESIQRPDAPAAPRLTLTAFDDVFAKLLDGAMQSEDRSTRDTSTRDQDTSYSPQPFAFLPQPAAQPSAPQHDEGTKVVPAIENQNSSTPAPTAPTATTATTAAPETNPTIPTAAAPVGSATPTPPAIENFDHFVAEPRRASPGRPLPAPQVPEIVPATATPIRQATIIPTTQVPQPVTPSIVEIDAVSQTADIGAPQNSQPSAAAPAPQASPIAETVKPAVVSMTSEPVRAALTSPAPQESAAPTDAMERKIVAVPNAMAPERASTENQAIVTIVPRDGVDPRQALMPGTRPNEKTPTALHVVDPADSDATFEAPQPQAATRTTPVGSSALLAQLNAGESVEPVTTRSAPAMPPPTANAAAPRIETADTAAATNTRSTQLDSAPSMSSVTPAMPDPSALRPIVASDIPALRGMRGTIHPATAQVAVHVAKAANEGVERITIKLSPPELGRIDVKLDVGVDGRIQAVFAAERAATVDILQRDVRELERALQSAGLNTDAGSLSFSLRDHGQRGGFGSLFGSGREAAMPELDTDTTVESSPVPRHDAGSGRLDIRI